MALADEIRTALEGAFQPTVLEIVDDSESHRGHGGFREGGESHWKVVIVAPALGPMTRIARHRAVHAALGKGIIRRIHALNIDAR